MKVNRCKKCGHLWRYILHRQTMMQEYIQISFEELKEMGKKAAAKGKKVKVISHAVCSKCSPDDFAIKSKIDIGKIFGGAFKDIVK